MVKSPWEHGREFEFLDEGVGLRGNGVRKPGQSGGSTHSTGERGFGKRNTLLEGWEGGGALRVSGKGRGEDKGLW